MYVCVLHQINSNFQDIRNVFGPKGLPKGRSDLPRQSHAAHRCGRSALSLGERGHEKKDMKKLFRDVDIYRFTMIYQDLP